MTSLRTARAAATCGLSAALLVLGLTGCDDTLRAAPAADTASDQSAPRSSEEASEPPSDPAPTSDGRTLADLGPRDTAPRVEFPGPDAVFPDGSSAGSDGATFRVTTPAEESFSVALPTEAEGWVLGTSVHLGDAGIGYVVSQSGGEYLHTFLVVLDDGELYIAEHSDDVVFGQFAGEGPFFETFTTDDGNHLVTTVEDAPDGGAVSYEWAVRDRVLVPTRLADPSPDPSSGEDPGATDADFPEAVDAPQQGGTYGVVVLADGSDAELAAAQEAVAEHGFTAYTAEIGCLDGAGPALDIADGTLVSYLVFADVDAAQDFASVYTYLDDDAGTPGVAEARTYCMDG